jgi:hypothetical protein
MASFPVIIKQTWYLKSTQLQTDSSHGYCFSKKRLFSETVVASLEEVQPFDFQEKRNKI